MGSTRRPRSVRPQYGTALFFLTLFTLALAGACTDILGIHDRTLTSGSGGTGGNTGGGGTGGSTGGGGTGGVDDSCQTDADCAGTPFGEHCADGHCVECVPGAGDDCALGLYCDVTHICTIGCADDADCKPNGGGPLTCDTTTHQCKGCGPNAPCPAGSKCDVDNGVCVPGCDQTSDCPTSDWACCNKQCRNVTKDVLNCGACEDPCVPDQSTTWICLDGGCVYQSCLPGWDNCDKNVAKGNGCETDTQNDPNNCGGCKTKCEFDHAVAGCSVGNCTIASCVGAFRNCDEKLMNGCEVDTSSSAENCGSCGASCAGMFPNANGACQDSVCVPAGCKTGFGDCDNNKQNGCETSTNTDAQHCGGCGTACALPHATSKCTAGACAIDTCDPGFKDCNGNPADGCEADLNSDVNNCGTCAKQCVFPHAGAMCNGGVCGMGACTGDYADCDGLTDDGCEINTAGDKDNCGGCGHACPGINATATCSNKACVFTCSNGFGNCDGLDANGCETNLSNTVDHCGSCPKQCMSVSGGTPYCFASMCGESNCPAGHADCNASPADGCEVDLAWTNDCGSCGNHCSTTNGTPSCNGSVCAITCNTGYGNCNNNVADGCEQALNTNANCTGCGVQCGRPHAITSCGTGSCQIVGCDPGYADCNGNPSDGCEANLNTDLDNCGSCNKLCNPAHGVGACVAGACTIQSCNAPYANCNGGVLDGCEVNLNTDPIHCGTCATQCSFPNAGATCNGGSCQIGTCNPPYANCNGSAADGCEANLQTNTQNCGGCGSVCANSHGSATCTSGMCILGCDQGYKNCNGVFSDGCERSILTLMDCGDCNVPCNLPNAVESCDNGTCHIVSCEGGNTNCDNIAANGCECPSSCVSGTCQGCGDGVCNAAAGETCMSCSIDCGTCPFCGDQSCNGAETCSTCPNDCGSCCGNASCEPIYGENCGSCPNDCGSCCGNNSCEAIYGETCMTCPDDCGVCAGCGDAICGAGETCNSCPGDCGPCCPNGSCDAIYGETCASCPDDCGACASCGDGICSMPMEDCVSCPGDCCPTGSGSGSSSSSSSSSSSGSGGLMDGGVDGGACPPDLGITCDMTTCTIAGQGCCYGMGSPGCSTPPSCMPPNGVLYQCDDKTECGAGICCFTPGVGANCTGVGMCGGASQAELCVTPSNGSVSCECSQTPTAQKCCPAGGVKNSFYPTCQPIGMVCK